MTGPLARAIDTVAERSIVGSFSRVGYALRARLFSFAPTTLTAGQVVVITGATSGLGRYLAEQAAAGGATVILVGRSAAKTRAACDDIVNAHPAAVVHPVVADMGSLASVRQAAEEILALTPVAHALIHNAGAITPTWTIGPDGTEVTVASQVVGPFALTRLLEPALTAAAPGRVITVTSGGMYSWKFDLATLQMTPQDYDGVKAYARVKRAQVVLTHEWARRTSPTAILFASMHPGWTDTPGLATSLPTFYRLLRPWLRTPAQGADTVLWLLETPTLAAHDGALFLDRSPRGEHKMSRTRPSDALADQRALWAWCLAQTDAAPHS